ncbi:uncharacterized protein TNCV_766491 [Trichonephila clavipes]|nr:uncharacterized protein TNCV_766491 [Trichonephila clavipes]
MVMNSWPTLLLSSSGFEYWCHRIPVVQRSRCRLNLPKLKTLAWASCGSLVSGVAAVAEWYGHRIVAGFVTSSSPVPLKTHRVGQRCTLNLSRAETSSRWCGVVARRGGASSGVVHVT